MNAHDFQGTVIIPVQQLIDIIELKVAEGVKAELDRRQREGSAQPLPEYLTAEEAATLLGYKSKGSLRKYHHRELTPTRREGKRLFYRSGEVIKLKKRLFNEK